MSDKDQDKLLDHEYDGIKELDNNLPLWWLWTFFGAIIFSFIYWIHYQLGGGGLSMDEELKQDMAIIEEQRAAAQNIASTGDGGPSEEELVAQGAKIFKVNCASCHKEDGGGSIGPNLTDDYWIHGQDKEAIQKVVEEGVLSKGMPPWKAILKPTEVQSVVAFVSSLKGQNVKNGKEPQGDKVN